jgi:hypothetical protein
MIGHDRPAQHVIALTCDQGRPACFDRVHDFHIVRPHGSSFQRGSMSPVALGLHDAAAAGGRRIGGGRGRTPHGLRLRTLPIDRVLSESDWRDLLLIAVGARVPRRFGLVREGMSAASQSRSLCFGHKALYISYRINLSGSCPRSVFAGRLCTYLQVEKLTPDLRWSVFVFSCISAV